MRSGRASRGVLLLPGDAKLTMQVFAGFEEVADSDLVLSTTAPGLRRVALHRYLADKVQCVLERIEARDLADIAAVVELHPRLQRTLRRAVAAQDALLMSERLLGWTDEHCDRHAGPPPRAREVGGRAVKRSYRFVEPCGVVGCTLETGAHLELPVISGILKHPAPEQLRVLLTEPAVARKYTLEALRKAPWNALRQFPRLWLLECLPHARVPAGRRRALEFMLEVELSSSTQCRSPSTENPRTSPKD
jgi:hypothetical protein